MNYLEMKSEFCKRIHELRINVGMSISELSRRSGLPLAMLEALDQGEIPEAMMVTDAWNLARAFGCKIHELFK